MAGDGDAAGSRPPRPGRPRDPRADQAILEAALELLGEVGYGKLTIEAVAARARVGKTTVYRRWRSKGQLVVEVLIGLIHLGPTPDTGSTRDDLLAFLQIVVRALGAPLVGRSVPGLANDLPEDSDLAKVFRAHIIGPKRQRIMTIMRRAVQRGEVPATVDFELITDLLLGPVLWRALLTGQSLDDHALAQLVDHVLRAVRVEPEPSAAR